MIAGLGTGRDLEDEQMRRASVLSLFSFSLFSSIQIWMSERHVVVSEGAFCTIVWPGLVSDYGFVWKIKRIMNVNY